MTLMDPQQQEEALMGELLNAARTSEHALLSKLQEMVPIMPRERQLTKLEIINYVIDYIRQLKESLVYAPA